MEDFCDRIPGQHTGRLSLELQAREAADWQRKVDDLQKQLDSANRIIQIKNETIILHEKRCDNLREELDELSDRVVVLHERIIEQNNAMRNAVKASPAAGESPPISPEAEPDHGLTSPATPSAAEVFRKALGADSEWAWTWHCNIAMPLQDHHGMSHEKANRCAADLMLYLFDVDVTRFDEWLSFPWATPSAAVGADIVPRAEYDKAVELLCQIGDIAHDASNGPERPDTYWDIRQMAYGFRECVERVPSDSKPTNVPESEDTPHHKPVMGPVVGTAKVSLRDWCQQSSGTRFPEPSPPAAELQPSESPEVSGEIRDLKYALEWIDAKRAGNPQLKPAALEMLNEMQVHYEAAVARLQNGESISSTSQVDVPAESPDDWVVINDPEHVIRKCDQISDYGTQWYGPSDITAALGKHYKNCGFKLVRCRRKDLPVVPVVPPAMPSPWRPMTDDYPRDKVLWVARDDGLVYTERNPDDWPLAKAVAWMPAVTPLHPNSAPPVVPKTRTVTLWEYSVTTSGTIKRLWSEEPFVRFRSRCYATGRTCECEVPE